VRPHQTQHFHGEKIGIRGTQKKKTLKAVSTSAEPDAKRQHHYTYRLTTEKGGAWEEEEGLE